DSSSRLRHVIRDRNALAFPLSCPARRLDRALPADAVAHCAGGRALGLHQAALRPRPSCGASAPLNLQASSFAAPSLRALGSDRSLRNVHPEHLTSEMLSIADIARTSRNVRVVPKPDSCSAANQLGYSITSSAMANTLGGMVRPRAFAVRR